jgi:hypothetical protein
MTNSSAAFNIFRGSRKPDEPRSPRKPTPPRQPTNASGRPSTGAWSSYKNDIFGTPETRDRDGSTRRDRDKSTPAKSAVPSTETRGSSSTSTENRGFKNPDGNVETDSTPTPQFPFAKYIRTPLARDEVDDETPLPPSILDFTPDPKWAEIYEKIKYFGLLLDKEVIISLLSSITNTYYSFC